MSPHENKKTVESGKPVQVLLRAIDGISRWEGRFFSFLIVVAALQVCYELTLRYAFNAPTTWGLEMTLYLCGITYLMSGAYADHLDAHIRVDIFYTNWRPRTRALVDLFITDTLFLFFCIVLVWQSGIWFWEAASQGLTSGTIWDPPIWPMRLFMVLGSGFLLLSSCGRFIRDFYAAFNINIPTDPIRDR
jgi:TRAP-type mannitol/chloroaromatic compound transport system permease small subunit